MSRIPLLVAAALLLAGAASAEPLAPNELGRVMILEYHKIDRPEGRWTRTPENFRRDLRALWERGYRLVALNDYLDGAIRLPRGTSPVILTFDDSSPGQFRYLERNGDWVLDPDCAVSILEAFEREHPGFGHAATFYVLPGADRPNRLFDQPELATRKLQYLASRGYEIGNHTLWHATLSRYPEPWCASRSPRPRTGSSATSPAIALVPSPFRWAPTRARSPGSSRARSRARPIATTPS